MAIVSDRKMLYERKMKDLEVIHSENQIYYLHELLTFDLY